jgi:hypothetical protein
MQPLRARDWTHWLVLLLFNSRVLGPNVLQAGLMAVSKETPPLTPVLPPAQLPLPLPSPSLSPQPHPSVPPRVDVVVNNTRIVNQTTELDTMVINIDLDLLADSLEDDAVDSSSSVFFYWLFYAQKRS